MNEQRSFPAKVIVQDRPDTKVFPVHHLEYPQPHDRRLSSVKHLLSSLYTVASVSHTSGMLLQSEHLLPEHARTIADDPAHIPKMTALMAAISHFGSIANASKKPANEAEQIALDRSMQYVIDLSPRDFFGPQRRALRLAKLWAHKPSLQPHHINAILHVLSKHIFSRQNALLSPFRAERLGVALPQLKEDEHSLPLNQEALWVRGGLLQHIVHDEYNGLAALTLMYDLRKHSRKRLAQVSDGWADASGDMIELSSVQERCKKDEKGIITGWNGLLDRTISLARLIEHPYRRIERSPAQWQGEMEKSALLLQERCPQIEVRFIKGELSNGKVVWAKEWMESLIENTGQNVERIWQDARVIGLPQTVAQGAHPVLEISTKTERHDFVMTFKDNATGFSEEYLRRGFQGQHGYLSHNHSTGTAMKELSEMVKVYQGRMELRNRYLLPDGKYIESSDPADALKDFDSAGGVLEVRLPLLAAQEADIPNI